MNDRQSWTLVTIADEWVILSTKKNNQTNKHTRKTTTNKQTNIQSTYVTYII